MVRRGKRDWMREITQVLLREPDGIPYSVNERKCAIIHLGEGPPPIGFSIWGSPFVEEYKYLGVLLGVSVPTERVFEGALQKLKDRAASFASIKTNFTSKILLAKIYLSSLLVPSQFLFLPTIHWKDVLFYHPEIHLSVGQPQEWHPLCHMPSRPGG